MPAASPYPLAIEIAPVERVADLVHSTHRSAGASVTCYRTCWVASSASTGACTNDDVVQSAANHEHQRSQEIDGYSDAWFNVEIVSPWRAPHVMRYIAAAEVATNEFSFLSCRRILPQRCATLRQHDPQYGDSEHRQRRPLIESQSCRVLGWIDS